ncbi:TlpA family protein disulfide reductase [Nocardia sp. NPDC052566]|uniref:TlpA family protein disulfide reductase n=1 Tax=Nocardia sp. NPDC052566 TaxID=3364330 RepID=UPI0037CC9BFA
MAWRWALAGVIVAVALAVAVWPRGEKNVVTTGSDGQRPPVAEVSAADRAAAGLPQCPQPAAGAVGRGPLAGITLDCLADGRPVDLAAALAGKPAVLNLWAYWCGPCRKELPDLADFAARTGGAITVLTVHSDPDQAKGLAMLAGLRAAAGAAGTPLPGVEDPAAKVRTAVGAPAVLPVTVLVRPDGTIAKVVVRAFSGVDDIAATVAGELGVSA